ncbi:uncharacterized protein TNCV_4256731 [Trichonephila clavipes]|nr:uncharacterized protein TNCV_4256731 [Trichonephila clavipes]
MDDASKVGTVQGHGGSVRVWGDFSWPYLGSLERVSTSLSAIRNPDLNLIEPVWDALEQGVKEHHTAPTNLIELWTALTKIWQVISVERF